MPTKFERIPVTNDLELSAALEQVRALTPGVRTATLVHDLAIRGATALVNEHERHTEALRRLGERSTGPDPGFDRELLGRIDQEAWRMPPDER